MTEAKRLMDELASVELEPFEDRRVREQSTAAMVQRQISSKPTQLQLAQAEHSSRQWAVNERIAAEAAESDEARRTRDIAKEVARQEKRMDRARTIKYPTGSGWLQTMIEGKWRDRWVTMENHKLFLHSHPRDYRQQDSLPVGNCVLRMHEADQADITVLSLHPAIGNGEVLQVRCKNNEVDCWKRWIEKSLEARRCKVRRMKAMAGYLGEDIPPRLVVTVISGADLEDGAWCGSLNPYVKITPVGWREVGQEGAITSKQTAALLGAGSNCMWYIDNALKFQVKREDIEDAQLSLEVWDEDTLVDGFIGSTTFRVGGVYPDGTASETVLNLQNKTGNAAGSITITLHLEF